MKIRNNAKIRAILKRLQDNRGEMGILDEKVFREDGTMLIPSIHGTEMSTDVAHNFSVLLGSLGPQAVETACLMEEFSAERGELWVGSNSQVKEGQRLAMIREARFAIKKLPIKDRQALLAEFQK